MTQTPTFQLADFLLDGRLADQLRSWREDGWTFDHMSKELYVMTDRRISITGKQLARWFHQLDNAA